MATKPNKVICVVCNRFEPQAWRKTMCKNCFHTLEEHNAGAGENRATLQVTSHESATFDICVTYDTDVIVVNETISNEEHNAVNINLGESSEGERGNVCASVGTIQLDDEVFVTLGDKNDATKEVLESASTSVLGVKPQSKLESFKKSSVVSTAVKHRQNALLNAKSRLIGKGGMGNDKRDDTGLGATTKRLWTKQDDDRISTVGGKTSDGELPKVTRFGKASENADKTATDLSDRAKSAVGNEESDSRNSSTKTSLRLKTAYGASEEESAGKLSLKKSPKDGPSGIIALKCDGIKKTDMSLKIRRNSNSSSGTNSEETPERKVAQQKPKNIPLFGNKGKPSTPPLPRSLSREGKVGQSKGHTSPKSTPKFSLRQETESAEVNEFKVKAEEMEKKCEGFARETSEMAEIIRGKTESEKRDKELIDRLKKRVEMLEAEHGELKAVRHEVEKSRALERELRGLIAAKQTEMQKHQRVCDEITREADRVRDENADLQLEIRETRQAMEEMYDQFRETEVDEFRDLQKELEITAKNCRLLQFKLRKCERKSDKAESDRQHYAFKIKELQNLFEDQDAKSYIKTLEVDLSRAKGETAHIQDELDIAEEKRIRLDDENRKLQEILERTDKKQFRMEMEIDKLHDQVEELRRQVRDGVENSDDESSQRKILDANQIWRM